MNQKNILCYGDSNTWGAPPDGSGKRYDRQTRWPSAMQRLLGDDYYVIEEGLCGRNTVWDDPVSEEDKNGLKQLIPILHSHAPLDLLIIMLGTNDFKHRLNVSADEIAISIGRLVNAARNRVWPHIGQAPDVLVICPPPMAETVNARDDDILKGGLDKSKQLATALRSFCDENKIRMFNAGDVIQSSPLDGVHFEAETHIKLADAIANEVRNII